MSRQVDTEGEVKGEIIEPPGDGETVGPLLIEIPLWRLGRIKLESHNSKSSLALFALILLMAVSILLAVIEAAIGTGPGIADLMAKVGQAMLLVIGFLIGTYNGKKVD